jgi:O-antigen/teichoic acid export membrane protein
MPSVSVKRRLVVGTLAQIAGQLISVVLSIAILKIASTRLGPDGYGLYATAISFVSIFSLLADLGVNAITSRELAKDPSAVRRILSDNMGLRLTLSILIVPFILALSLVAYPHTPRLPALIAIASCFVAFDAARCISLAYFTSILRNDVAAVVTVLQQVVLLSSALLASRYLPSVFAFTANYVVANAIAAVAAYAALGRSNRSRPTFSPKRWKSIIRMSISVGIIQLVDVLYLRVDAVMLSLIDGTRSVAIYSIAYSVVLSVMVLPGFIMSSVSPLVATASHAYATASIQKSYHYVMVFAPLIGLVGFLLSSDIVALVSGPKFAAAGPVLAILLFSACFSYVQRVFGYSSVALNKHRKLLYVSVLCLTLNVSLNLILIPRYSTAGAAWATVSSEIVSLVAAYLIFVHETSIRLRTTRIAVKVVASSVPPLLIGYFVRSVLSGQSVTVRLLLTILVITLSYVLTLAAMRGLPSEMTNLLRRRGSSTWRPAGTA